MHAPPREERRVSKDVQYEQVHVEMRRYRDFERLWGEWFCGIMLAVIGALGILLASGRTILEHEGQRYVAMAIVLLLGLSGIAPTYYGGWRYLQLRAWYKKNLQPPEEPALPDAPLWKPRNAIILIESLLTVVATLLIWKLPLVR